MVPEPKVSTNSRPQILQTTRLQVMSAVREGHRPLLSPAQAAALARKLFGVHCDPETCKELPSYDDRNFLIKACASHSAEQQTPCVHGTAAPASAEPMRWVLKVHNTRDTHRHAYFQVMDQLGQYR